MPLEGQSPAVGINAKLIMAKLGVFDKMPLEGHSPAVGTDAMFEVLINLPQ